MSTVIDLFFAVVDDAKRNGAIGEPIKRIDHPLNRLDHPLKRLDHPLKRLDHPANMITTPNRGALRIRELKRLLVEYFPD